ncbi:hypothetical protein VB796_04350 [Arcicella sp. LKC2W]|uniref:hypothetical protein n=1 Tax=Arcicella sp. LKC2W TaxID=2984198 RepID=UPI002B1F2E27|nr:hypothetical protein [Arcicella sp. LKC2W]MEA5458252.1 hypothetical protein [Arcicella sp. LKC2W]
MKSFLTFIFLLFILNTSLGQLANNNTFSVQVDGKDFVTQPRRIKIGPHWWITANSIKPDKMLRVWLFNWNKDKSDVVEPGTYLVVDADKPDTKENKKKVEDLGKYKGVVVMKYVEEIREPRMEYHVGKSQNNDETMEVKIAADGSIEATFNGSLAGSYWKEKTTATVFGGLGRLVNKMEDKATTSATGYDSDIDPEGNGYKKQDKTDKIILTNGKLKLKMK